MELNVLCERIVIDLLAFGRLVGLVVRESRSYRAPMDLNSGWRDLVSAIVISRGKGGLTHDQP